MDAYLDTIVKNVETSRTRFVTLEQQIVKTCHLSAGIEYIDTTYEIATMAWDKITSDLRAGS